jgi:chemotaxis response regulator CheB
MTTPIRVIVANRPRLMRELVLEAIAEQPDIEILAEIQNEPDISKIVDETRPDFLIIALDESNERPVICDALLRRFPDMKILALAPERNSCMFFWASFDIYASPVEASEAGILSTLRGKGQYV